VADRVTFSLDAQLGSLAAMLDDEARAAMLDGARIVADEAAAHHPYTNRTGRLQSRTVAGRVRGNASRGRVSAEVLGDTRYGSFVEEGTSRSRPYPYLAPAAAAKGDEVAEGVAEACARALERAFR